MKAGLPERFHAADDRIYDAFGVDAVLNRVTPGTVDPRTGLVVPSVPAEPVQLVVILGEREQQIENGAIIQISTIEARQELKQNDLITVGSSKFVVTAVNPDASLTGNPTAWLADVEGQAQ